MNLAFISQTAFFSGCTKEETKTLIDCLQISSRLYKKGEYIYLAGTPVTDIGLVLSGSVRIENDDIWGNKSVLSLTEPGEVFAEAYACVPGVPLSVSVIANEDCEILFIGVPRLLKTCGNACPAHQKVIQNLISISARKNLALSQRIFHTSPKTIRERLLSYFYLQMTLQNTNRITIPFDRQQLADYLNLDRSALSKELGKMKREGLLEYRKNQFELKLSETGA